MQITKIVEYIPLGIPDIDKEHEEFVKILNMQIETRFELVDILNRIVEFWIRHTTTETRFMITHDFPKAEMDLHLFYHSIVRNFLLSTLTRLALDTSGETFPDTLAVLGDMFDEHFNKYDRVFEKYI